jgi:hypothetical protein
MSAADFLRPGASVWLLDRTRVRSGFGPQRVTVADVAEADGKLSFRTAGTRGWYDQRDAFATKSEAQLAWFERADAEYQHELARFNVIVRRLLAYRAHQGNY